MGVWRASCAAGSFAIVAVLAVVALPTSRASAVGAEPRVTVIGDSVLTGVIWYQSPTATLEQDLDLKWQVAVCRRLVGVSCTFEGVTPPNFVDVVNSVGRELGPTVVVVMGYNDFEQTFAASVEASIQALVGNGVTRILWATLRESRHPYVHMNDILRAAAARHPQLTVVDWNAYSRGHPEWFQNDDMHLLPEGGAAMATFLHAQIVKALATPIRIAIRPSRLPVARVGRSYLARLAGDGGAAPYRWSLAGGSLPKGLHLNSRGLIVGVPARTGRAQVVVRAADASGGIGTQREALTVVR